MAEKNNKIDVYNKVSDCSGLESLFIDSLPKCEYTSDVVIVYAHHLLTNELDYKCAIVENEHDENGEDKKVYKTIDSLPVDWLKYKTYKIIYKTEEKTCVLSGQKNSRKMVVHFSNEHISKTKSSSEIILNKYISSQFLTAMDLTLICNLSDLRCILLKCFAKVDKYKAKLEHDKDLVENSFGCSTVPVVKKNPYLNESFDTSNPLRNDRGCASPAYSCLNSDRLKNVGKHRLQDKNKHKPAELPPMINDPILFDENYTQATDTNDPPNKVYLT